MGFFLRWLSLLLLVVFPAAYTAAQLTITSPVPRMVFQRSLANEARVMVAGMAPATATTVEARFVPLVVGQGTTTTWTSLSFLSGSSTFRGNVTVSAGWYRLDVRAKADTTLLALTHVNRVGIGEVFVVAGQSNAAGGFQRVASAVEDRVSCLDFQQDSLSDQLLPLQFSSASYGSSIGPSQPPHLWSTLGDKLVERLNVPVLFFGAALGGSSSTEWQQGAADNLGTTTNSSVYRRLGEALLHYVVRTGARAVLWHQGETDTQHGISNQTYYNNINYTIQKSRQQLNSNPLAWMISRVSYINNQTSPGIITAQNQLIADLPNAFPGPATDSIVGPDNRPDNMHMEGPGLVRFTNSWDQALTTAFFQNAVPFIPADTAALITSAYTLPLTRRQGDTLAVASLRSNPYEVDNYYVAQIVRVSDGATVYESPRSSDNPILVKIPASLPNGQYRIRTCSTHPVIIGTLSEPFNIQQSSTPGALLPILHQPLSGGNVPAAIKRFTYRYEPGSHGFFAMIESSAPVEVRLQRIDGGTFTDSGWNLAPPSSQAPDYDQFANFNYIRDYPPVALAVGGVDPVGKYRYSVRLQGDTGQGLWYDLIFLGGRVILYQNETIPPIPPILTADDLPVTTTCLSGTASVAIEVSEGTMNIGNSYTVRLSDANGSFANETIIGTSTTSPITVTFPIWLIGSNTYRMRVVASNPAVASTPSQPLSICTGNGADLSIAMSLSKRTPRTGEPTTLTLVLTNDGPMAADSVVVQSRLPAGVDFVGDTSGIISTSNIVTFKAGTVENGTSLQFVFRLQANQAGRFITAAQITASSKPDPDSQPNSGTGDGQDDEATVDFRTPDANGTTFVSPNPNQVPSPTVESNQPPTDSTKADLSLAITTSSLAVSLSQVISVTLTVSNRGGATASNVSLQTLLPAGWQLTNATSLTVSGQTVTGSISSIPAGGSGTVLLSIQIGSAGTIKAQIASATPADPDSTPGNGYTNGEDDEAAVAIRVR